MINEHLFYGFECSRRCSSTYSNSTSDPLVEVVKEGLVSKKQKCGVVVPRVGAVICNCANFE